MGVSRSVLSWQSFVARPLQFISNVSLVYQQRVFSLLVTCLYFISNVSLVYQQRAALYKFIGQLMKYASQSAIQKHYMDSILPHPTYPIQKQILKTKQFYQPEQFIWNNPHRASHRMYKFYHVYNQNYAKHKEPVIKRQEELDREAAEMERIHRLIAFRNKTREEFAKKQKTRELLESRTTKDPRSTFKSVKTDHGLGYQSQYKHLTELKDDVFKKSIVKQAQKSQRIIRIENTYKQGLKKYDIKTEEIHKLINGQHEDYHYNIRSEFAARKNANDTASNRFGSKLKRSNLFEEQLSG